MKANSTVRELRDDDRRVRMRICKLFKDKEEADFYFSELNTGIEWSRPWTGYNQLNRDTAWYSRCECYYKYSRLSMAPKRFTETLQALAEKAAKALDIPIPPDSCNINRYCHLRDSVGWHRDNEMLFQAVETESTIISISLGASRYFDVRDIDSKTEQNSFLLEHGDLMTMEGAFQKYYEHRIAKNKGEDGIRINLTFRYIKKHHWSCVKSRGPSTSYFFSLGKKNEKSEPIINKNANTLFPNSLFSVPEENVEAMIMLPATNAYGPLCVLPYDYYAMQQSCQDASYFPSDNSDSDSL